MWTVFYQPFDIQVEFGDLVKDMMDADIALMKKDPAAWTALLSSLFRLFILQFAFIYIEIVEIDFCLCSVCFPHSYLSTKAKKF